MLFAPLRVTILNWRDTTHPEGGGSEHFIERIAGDLAADGCDVEILCARHPRAGGLLERDGITFRHSGGRFGVYPAALTRLWLSRFGARRPDVVIDVHNGVPFFARLLAGCPVVVLVHHVHREQWRVVFGQVLARLGWWLESTVSPRVHRGCQYIAVSAVTRRELIELGARGGDIAVVHNGATLPSGQTWPRDPEPSLVVLGRLVPHKRVEHALDVLATLHREFPGLRLRVIGEGWWREQLEQRARELDVQDRVTFEGFVSEQRKDELLARSWLMLAPSVKEGWGLMVMDAAAHEVPSVAYRDAGGLSESIVHDGTGLLVESREELVAATRRLLQDHALRESFGQTARQTAAGYSWRTASTSVLQLLHRSAAGLRPTDAVDPTAAPDVSARPDRAVVIDLSGDHDQPGVIDLRDDIDRRDDGAHHCQNSRRLLSEGGES